MLEEKKSVRIIDQTQLWLLYANLPLGLLSTIVNAVVVAIIFSNKVEQSIIEGWIVAMMLVVFLRYVLYLNFKSKIDKETQYKKWEVLFAIGLFATALIWSASVILFFEDTLLSDHLLLSFVLGGMVSGAMHIAGYRLYLYTLYTVPILSVLMIYLLLEGNYYFGGMVALYMLITLSNAKGMADNSAKVQELQIKNDTLIDNLREEKNSVKVALEDATKANSIKDLFIGNISHEFRTPLNAIQGFSQVLQHQPNVPDRMVPILKKINASGNRLLSLVEILMQYSKYKSGSFEYTPSKGLIAETIETLVSEERVRVLEKELKFEIDVPSNMVIGADFNMLKFILLVVIEDAIENASKESCINIKASLTSQNDVLLQVCNIGPVLTEAALAELFDPFAQMESKHENRNLAKGLGFYISKGLIEDAHMGSFILENTDQEGYCITLIIPQTE